MRGVTISSYVMDKLNGISTHTPHARCDKLGAYIFKTDFTFLLTHLMRGVTGLTIL